MGLSHDLLLAVSYSREFLYGMCFDLSDMEGELRHDRCMGLLLADCMQDVGATKPNARVRDVQALYLRAGFGGLFLIPAPFFIFLYDGQKC